MLAVRVALIALAVVTGTWFVLGIVQARDQNRANTLMIQPGTPSAAQTAQILHLLDGAGTLNPDREIDLMRAQAEQRGGDYAAAVRTEEEVARDEPQNAYAWLALSLTAQRRDPALARLANQRVRQLSPPVKATP